MTETSISVVDSKSLVSLLGAHDQHLRKIRDSLGVDIAVRDNGIQIRGSEESVAQATEVFEQLKSVLEREGSLPPESVSAALSVVAGEPSQGELPVIQVLNAGRKVQPRTSGQRQYVQAIAEHDLVFCVGPAGTGKTYLAVAMAVSALRQERIRKIVLVRPAVEAGENLGFLPGDMQAKINPYLRPLLDALREMMDFDQIRRYTDQDVIEVIPLAYMRGRTLNEAFIILDEAQNTTIAQMKMFLTRMGHGSKIVVSGDSTQIDLPAHAQSGLVDAMRRLRGIQGIEHVGLSNADIVRHRLVQEIVQAYEEKPRRRNSSATH